MEDNYSSGCGWRRVGRLAESGGIKLHYLKHSLVRRNVVQGTIAATGLWVDHSNHNSRITANLVTGADGSAFFLEATYGPTLIDHNVFVNPANAKPFNIATWRQETGCEAHSQTVAAVLEFSTADWRLRGTIPTLESPRVPALTADFLDITRSGSSTHAGPFLHPSLKAEITSSGTMLHQRNRQPVSRSEGQGACARRSLCQGWPSGFSLWSARWGNAIQRRFPSSKTA